jgi:hypothetical protein
MYFYPTSKNRTSLTEIMENSGFANQEFACQVPHGSAGMHGTLDFVACAGK